MKTIAVIRKPLESTVASNVLKHGCGGLHIDACRTSYEEGHVPPKDANIDKPSSWTSEDYNGDKPYILNAKLKTRQVYTPSGRYPANLILGPLAAEALDEQSGCSHSSVRQGGIGESLDPTKQGWRFKRAEGGYTDTGGASRYFKNIEGGNMKTIAMTRKPLAGTVASNILEHGCGGLNIDASRIEYGERGPDRPFSQQVSTDQHFWGNASETLDKYKPSGRFPSNLILNEAAAESLDEQSGDRPSTGNSPSTAVGSESIFRPNQGGYQKQGPIYNDASGASRYFKNVKEDLVSYLRDLITPPEGVVKVVPLDIIEPTGEDESVHGFIVMGTPTSDQCEELLRICKPGAHVLLIAPKEQPTGHTGMCRMEDAGFEIRDTILLLLEPGGFWYIPKPSRSERDAGCHKLRVPGHEAVNRKEGSKGLQSPRAGAGRTANKVGNSHPTVKPFAIMQALMEGQEGPVVDPFMGSGSTGIAAIHTGHDFIGIEREEEYLKIADARVRHWADSEWRGRMTEVVSDLEQEPETEPEVMDLGSLFGMGGSE